MHSFVRAALNRSRDSQSWGLGGGDMLEPKQTASGLPFTRPISLESLTFVGGTVAPPTATLTLGINGKKHTTQQKSTIGVIDAALKAVNDLVPNNAMFEKIDVQSAKIGSDSDAEVIVHVVLDGQKVFGQARHSDTIVATVFAYVKALNQLYHRLPKQP